MPSSGSLSEELTMLTGDAGLVREILEAPSVVQAQVVGVLRRLHAARLPVEDRSAYVQDILHPPPVPGPA